MGYGLAEEAGARVAGAAAGVAAFVGPAVLAGDRPAAVGEGLPGRFAVAVTVVFGVPAFDRAGVAVGVNIAGAVEDGELVHAETAAETATIKATQPATAGLAPTAVPGEVVRTFIEPPHGAGRGRCRFPAPEIPRRTSESAPESAPEENTRCQPLTAPRPLKQTPRGSYRHARGLRGQAIACFPSGH